MRHGRWVARGMRHGHHAAVTCADADDGAKAEILPERFHILDIFIQRIACRISFAGTALAAMIKIDKLHMLREG